MSPHAFISITVITSILSFVPSVRALITEERRLLVPHYWPPTPTARPSHSTVYIDHDDSPDEVSRNPHDDVGTAAWIVGRRNILGTAALISSAVAVGLRSKPAWGTTVDPKTGIRLPDPGEIESAVPDDWNDVENPFDSADQNLFSRLDNLPDSVFYEEPRFVEHVDDNAVKLMTEFISNSIQPGDSVLDLCSSWVSHIDERLAKKMFRISGLGMNAKELESNPVLTDWVVQDLNENPRLSKYADASFDVVLLQLSVDYLTKPLDVFKEVGRILKHGGRVFVLFSNRLFFSKAVAGWTGGDDIDHAFTVGCYLRFCGGGFQNIKAKDLSTRKGGRENRIVNDPLYVVSAVKE